MSIDIDTDGSIVTHYDIGFGSITDTSNGICVDADVEDFVVCLFRYHDETDAGWDWKEFPEMIKEHGKHHRKMVSFQNQAW